ncbi:hypothetical protein [Yinghuangia seranimata]|uniref:hypothetical protein n=1 Tax=Yinghuangia seranimata TaxID=408067 RepID=UPI00248AD3B5|nr:hypothetical protein [Yinghuangia seranimata]MDI2126446.1 hypothetical protein [Yinghuangia seranimata]
MNQAGRTEWWESLPAGIRDQVDGYVLQDDLLSAINVIVDVGFVARGIGVGTAQLIVGDRYAHYGDRIARTPDSPLDAESLRLRADGAAGTIVAIEAIWDGDTVHDWFVILLAVTADPAADHHLATIYRSAGERHLGDDKTTWNRRHPSAAAAERAGRQLAAGLNVPFHFASPDDPDDRAPRWAPQGTTTPTD